MNCDEPDCVDTHDPIEATKSRHKDFVEELEALLQAAFYCAAQGAQDTSKVDMFQTLKVRFIARHGYYLT